MDIETINKLYTYELWTTARHESPKKSWYAGQLRYGDQCSAMGYAFGVKSYNDVKDLFGFTHEYGYEPHPLVGAKKQVEILFNNRTRTPKGVLDVGGGRGEISVSFSYLGIDTQMIEPSFACRVLVAETKTKFDMGTANFPVIEKPFNEAVKLVNWTNIDTVIFCESIEHIEKEEFDEGFSILENHLFENKGLLIVLNWINCHPLPAISEYHCHLIDDTFYDKISENKEVVYRRGSHLVLQY